MTVVHRLQPELQRVIVLRQANSHQWRVEGYERHAGGWRYTWLLNPAEPERRARQYAARLAQQTGLPLGEQRLGQQISLIPGVLGRAA